MKVSFDYDGTLSTDKGLALAKKAVKAGDTVYVITARGNVSIAIKARAAQAGIIQSNIYATGSNAAKIAKIKELNIDKHYDNNPDVIKELGSVGVKI